MGADAELANLVLGLAREQATGRAQGTGREASRALLREVVGVRGSAGGAVPGAAVSGAAGPYAPAGVLPAAPPSYAATWYPTAYGVDASHAYEDPQDVGRRYLASNGGCVYVDLDHLEVCTPEVASAWDFVAAWHAMLRIARDAQRAANAGLAQGQRIVVLVNSSDGHGNSYGSHLSFLVTRRLWLDVCQRRLHPGLFVLAAHQVSSIVFAGQGKVGAENGRSHVRYQIAQRPDFVEQILSEHTTFRRPIINRRHEPLCGHAGASPGGASLARLHCIFYDSTLCHVSTLLKVGTMQIVLSMLEAGFLDASLMLDDPLEALTAFSHDPSLAARARLADGRAVTAVELQSMFCERARAYVEAGGCDGLVPGAARMVELWQDTLAKLAARDLDALAPRLDWVLKQAQIERVLASRGLDWSAPEAKHLDHLYSSLDPDEGLYWALERAGLTETLVDDARSEHLRHAPPDDTRAWRRAVLLRDVPEGRVRHIDWDHIELEPAEPGAKPVVLDLGDPLGGAATAPPVAAADEDDTWVESPPSRRSGEPLLS
jgi:proteasome accessory factor A